ncbi:MAG: hypothetical protein CUN53_06065 [Phototrophicales bacterium]|nr:MAG: hypothetical protein CUN53_06065 [Phototrophicales bacterium]
MTPIVSESHHLPDVAVDLVIHVAAISALPSEVGMSPEAHLRWTRRRRVWRVNFAESFGSGAAQSRCGRRGAA